ncbi:MAG: hypothetical protein QNJ47_01945 [Nostocaceae cyanobacterium]|nr:hypothetical protein [Nostocaceae cyanobacterium]
MNKFTKLLMTTTAIASVFGWNIHTTQAQTIEELRDAYCVGSLIGGLMRGNTAAIPLECTQNQSQSQGSLNTAPRSYNQYQRTNRRDIERYIDQQNRRVNQIERYSDWLTEPDNVCLSCSN